MPTSPITNVIRDPSGDPVVGVPVVARLVPPAGFALDGTEIQTTVATISDADGEWTLDLEQQANIAPANETYWEIEERLAGVDGGTRMWAASVGAHSSTLGAALIVPGPEELSA